MIDVTETFVRVCNHPACGHDSDGHHLIATSEDPADGGVIVCPVRRCLCLRTWTYGDRPLLVMPDQAWIAVMQATWQDRAGHDGAMAVAAVGKPDRIDRYALAIEAARVGGATGSDGSHLVLIGVRGRRAEYPSE